MRRLLLLLVLAAGLVLPAACTQRDPDVLIVATEGAYRPFTYYDPPGSGNLTGFDVDLFRAIADQAGLRFEFQATPFDAIIAGLTSGEYDAAISAMTITDKRREQVDFSDPYYDSWQSLAVHEDTTDIRSTADLNGRKIGVQRGTTGEMVARGVDGATVLAYDTIDLAFNALTGGSVDAVINDAPSTRAVIEAHGTYRVIDDQLASEQYGIALPKGSDDLLARINTALTTLRENGTLERLRNKWITPDAD